MISSCNVGPFENQASSVTMETSKLVEGDNCNDFEIEQKLSRRVHLFYLEFSTAKVCRKNTSFPLLSLLKPILVLVVKSFCFLLAKFIIREVRPTPLNAIRYWRLLH